MSCHLVQEGYVPCACRDCREIAIGKRGEAVCVECEEAGCELDSECKLPHAYCEGDERAGDPDIEVNGVACCPVCRQPW